MIDVEGLDAYGSCMAGTASIRRPRRRIPPGWRKALLTVHVGSSVGLLGVDAALLLLGVTGANGADPRTVYPAMHLLGSALLVPLALVSLTGGVALGLLTPWGLVRHWWVLLKLVLTTVGSVLAVLVLAPALGRADAAVDAGRPVVDGLLWRAPTGASVVLLATLVLSVAKPFGRVPIRRA
jgi:hypothetical protein